MMKNNQGIYKLTINKLIYIGQSINLKIRERVHLSDLSKNKHKNEKMQSAFIKSPNVHFEILEYVSDCTQLSAREKHWIIQYNCIEEGLNIKNPNNKHWEIKYTPEIRLKMRNAKLGKPSPNAMFSDIEALEIRQEFMDGSSITAIAQKYKKKRHSIGSICNNRSYKRTTAYPEDYLEWFSQIKEARKMGKRPTKTGWKHSKKFIEKLKEVSKRPKPSLRKLTDDQAIEILKRLKNGERTGILAEEFEVSPQLISSIRAGRSYKHLTIKDK